MAVIFWVLLAYSTGYCMGRAGEINARIKARKRHYAAYGKYPQW